MPFYLYSFCNIGAAPTLLYFRWNGRNHNSDEIIDGKKKKSFESGRETSKWLKHDARGTWQRDNYEQSCEETKGNERISKHIEKNENKLQSCDTIESEW